MPRAEVVSNAALRRRILSSGKTWANSVQPVDHTELDEATFVPDPLDQQFPFKNFGKAASVMGLSDGDAFALAVCHMIGEADLPERVDREAYMAQALGLTTAQIERLKLRVVHHLSAEVADFAALVEEFRLANRQKPGTVLKQYRSEAVYHAVMTAKQKLPEQKNRGVLTALYTKIGQDFGNLSVRSIHRILAEPWGVNGKNHHNHDE